MDIERQSPLPSFRSILLATDFSAASTAAYEVAVDLCLALGSTLCIYHVFEYADTLPSSNGVGALGLDRAFLKARDSLTALESRCKQAGVTCQAQMGSGVPSLSILETIQSQGIDLAVLGTNALHGFERLVFGSTAEGVLRKALCPVLTVGPQVSHPAHVSRHDGPVLFATDFHRSTTPAINHAASLCEKLASPLHCLHVLPRSIEAGPKNHVIPQIMSEALQHVAVEQKTTVAPAVCAIAFGSEVSNAVVDYARKQNAQLIVLGVRQASMLASHVPAHIAYRIITEAPCPVLTIAVAAQAELTPPMAACF